MLITFIRRHLEHRANDIAEYPDATAQYLVKMGVAEYYDNDLESILQGFMQEIEDNAGAIDLTDTTFIIPVFYDHRHRMENMLMTLAFIRRNFKTNIIIGEQGSDAFYFLPGYVKFGYDTFHRTRMINDMTRMADRQIVINWDCDNICRPDDILSSVQAIRNGADTSYPFCGIVVRVPRYMFKEAAYDPCSLKVDAYNHKQSSVGHAVTYNKESFISVGMENENMISWGPEDGERWHRFNTLGLNVHRSPGKMYHIDHFIGTNSGSQNPHFRSNYEEFYKVQGMKKEELREYVSGWKWAKESKQDSMTI